MILLKNRTFIYGFEDYGIIYIGSGCLVNLWGFNVPYHFENSIGCYIINKNLPVRAYEQVDPNYSYLRDVCFEPSLCENHKELLSDAKKLYVHPSCKLSRSLMAEKYKKSLNPYLSDAVVIPKPDYREFFITESALFVNDETKIVVRIQIESDNDIVKTKVKSFTEGIKLRDVISCQPDDSYGDHKPYKIDDMLNAEFVYAGDLLFISNSQSYALDILTNRLPTEKTVFEESVQESLSSETNKLDFDSLTSIKDMLESSDENTVAAGLKSLSMMDWMHYPNSIKLIFEYVDSWKWKYNPACNSTSVKYMMNTISHSNTRRYWPGRFDDAIYEQDYELFKQLKMHYDKIPQEKILERIRFQAFMGVSPEGIITPLLKGEAA